MWLCFIITKVFCVECVSDDENVCVCVCVCGGGGGVMVMRVVCASI